MALQRDTLYPGRFDTGDALHPQGAFRNRTTPTSQDGSYLEEQWLNDWDGFFASLLDTAGLSPDGNVDAVGASQYFAALQTVTRGNYVTAGGTANVITLADTSVTAYTDGMSLRFKVSLANTGATTLNVNNVGAVTVYGSSGLACQGGELTPGLATVVYSTELAGFVIVHCTGGNKQIPDATQTHHAVSLDQLKSRTSSPYVTVSLANGAMTWTLPKQTLKFRNPSLTTGALVEVSLNADLILTVPVGATLGTTSSLLANLIPVILYNSGSPVLGVVNLASGLDLSEAGLLSATAISASATSASVVYASVAVTNSPYITAGIVQSTQATAGAWATAPSVIPKGTLLAASINNFAFGQVWTDVAADRNFGTTYYNTTGKPIFISAGCNWSSSAGQFDLLVDGMLIGRTGTNASAFSERVISAIVMPNSSYGINVIWGTILFKFWKELR